MISKFDIAKALRDQAEAVCTANSYTLFSSDGKASPGADDAYIKEYNPFGNDNPIGYGGTSMQKGIYQLSVYVPKSQNKWGLLKMVDTINAHFVRGLKPTHNSQMLVIEKTTTTGNKPNDTHNVQHISVYFSVIG